MKARTIVVFDLDDTLYPEREFALSGFRAAGRWAEANLGIAGLHHDMAELFDAGHLGPLFGLALARHRPRHDNSELEALVAAYRNHEPEITLYDDAPTALAHARRQGPIGLITDGTAAVQRSKIRALGLTQAFDHIIPTDELGGRQFSKPHPLAYEQMETVLGRAHGDRMVYVGDNPSKDFIVPNARGWISVEIVRDARVHAKAVAPIGGAAQYRITSLDQLFDTLPG